MGKVLKQGAALLLLVLALPTAWAQPAIDTLSKIRSSHTIVIGVREASRPFSFLNDQKQPKGYAVDLCLNAVEEIKRELKLHDLKVQYKQVSGAERIPKLLAGEIDLECGSTTNTKARQEKVAFSYTYFVAAMRVLTPKDLLIDSVKDLTNVPIALSKGTTSEKLFGQLSHGELHAPIQVYANNKEAYQALKDGKARAFAQDDSLLLGLASGENGLEKFALSPMALSVEPYAVMLRKNDAPLLAIVDRSLARLYASGEINALYAKWFETETLTIKMGRLTRECFVRPNKEPGLAMILGYSI